MVFFELLYGQILVVLSVKRFDSVGIVFEGHPGFAVAYLRLWIILSPEE